MYASTAPMPDGEHATWSAGRHDSRTATHAYVIYPRGVPLGSSSAARDARWRNQHLTTAEVVFSGLGGLDALSLSEPLGLEIHRWFRAMYTDPMRATELCIRFIMLYDPATKLVQLYREDADPASAPEHTFTTPCQFPWEKLGLPPPVVGRP
ncbi:hypothetical protein DHEL01_v208045 [Diaporthe helianthi]|uniref:Uncharacterized protein n=1 Tax=Diaporthe helianthi TaxID=158607 RepID=A0A2P5HTI1_DIAHE|nr:hypothetical protein DHEL01_v208045 [Diaporthe helianthi]